MWLRTTMNVQMVNGSSMRDAFKTLYAQGGIPRFYRGVIPALIQSPISRFGDTFANEGMLALLRDSNIPMFAQTMCASAAAGSMRIMLMPVDAWKTIKQVHGADGLKVLASKAASISRGGANLWGYSTLWHGSLAQASATAVGHWPWFTVYNYMNKHMPWDDGTAMQQLCRNATIGLCASVVSDTASNGIRVLKTYRQTSKEPIGYLSAFNKIRAESGLFGWNGLFFRGLQTRFVSHGLNSMVFTVAWKPIQKMMQKWQDEDKKP